ncbi:post-PEP-CTERM-1 domain-containing protein [Massilia sp. SYSU DXS3249]
MHKPVFALRSVVALTALALAGSAFAAGQEGQTASKDPRTGKLRNATAAEARQLNELRAADRAAQKAARQAAGLPEAGVVRLQQNGVVAAHVDEESVMYSVMRRNADGTLEHDCVHGKTAADSSLTHSHPVSTQAKEHQNEVQ